MKSLIALVTVGAIVLGSAPSLATAGETSFHFSALPLCSSVPTSGSGCRTPPDFGTAEAVEHLGSKNFTYWVDGTTIRMAARTTNSTPPRLCCSFQVFMSPLSDKGQPTLWGTEYILPHLKESILTMVTEGDQMWSSISVYRGSDAPAEPVGVSVLKGHLESIEVNSPNLGETRKLTIYVPAAPPPDGGYPVVYIADGQSVAGFAPWVEKMIDDGKIVPVMLVGIWASDRQPDATRRFDGRSNEYLLGPEFDATSFAHHEAFVLQEVMPLAEKKFHASTYRDRRMTFGYSDGASWAITFATRHPDLFDQASGMAAGVDANMINLTKVPMSFRLFVGAGEYDLFRYSTRSICDKANSAGVECKYVALYTGHDSSMWNYGLEEALTHVFHHLL